MSDISELAKRALKIKEFKEQVAQQDGAQRQMEYDKVIKRITEEFEAGFAEILPLLKDAGITYKGGTQEFNYPSNATYIEFFYDGKYLKMDFNHRKSYRYEFAKKSYTQINYGTMTFGEWDKDRFIVWIYDELINKQ